MSIIKSLEDGALTKEEAIVLIEVITLAMEQLRPHFRRWWFRIIVDGIKVSLSELKEHLENHAD
jgi:hypothetical protein